MESPIMLTLWGSTAKKGGTTQRLQIFRKFALHENQMKMFLEYGNELIVRIMTIIRNGNLW